MGLVKAYNTDSNTTYNTSYIEEVSSKFQLKLQNNPNQDFNQPFDSDTGFTYDAAKAEFTGGQVQQKTQAPANSLSWATYTNSINLSGGSVLTGTGTGSPVITGNKLDLTGNTIKYVDYDANNNADSQQTGTVRLKMTPNYTGNPANNQYLFSVGKNTSSFNNLLEIYHNAGNKYLAYTFYDSTGALQGSGIFGVWNVTSGTTYEIALCFDFTTGATRMFVDGTQSGATLSNTFTRDSDINYFRIGSNRTGVFASNYFVEDFIYYETVLFTSNYTPGYTLPEYKYSASTVILPEMEYTGAGTLVSFDLFTTSETASPRYTIQIGRSGTYLYWDGAAWTASDGTYSQANDVTTFNANVATLNVVGEIYGQFKINFDNSNTQSAVADLTASLTAQIYSTSNPTIVFTDSIYIDDLLSFSAVTSATGSDLVKFTLSQNSQQKYWDGAAWSNSNGTYAQSNTAAEINTNASSFTSSGVLVEVTGFLHSDDGTTTPSLTSITMTYDFYSPAPDTIEKCVVWGYKYDEEGSASTASFTIYLTDDIVKYKTQTMINRQNITVTPDSSGYWEVELIENENMEGNIQYVFDFGNHEIFYRTVPNEDSKNFYALT